MKAVKLAIGLLIAGSTAFAGGGTVGSDQLVHQCAGTLQSYKDSTTSSVQVAIDFNNRSIQVQGADGTESVYQITSSERNNSYMKGIQFVRAVKVSGNSSFRNVTLRMPWTSYYNGSTHLSMEVGNNGVAGAGLECDKELYQGPVRF